MKKFSDYLLMPAMLSPTAGSCGTTSNNPKPTEPDTPTDSNALAIIVNGKSDFVIVLGENASYMELKAAEELQKYLMQITGAKLSIITDADAPAAKEIVIGQTNRESKGQFAREELIHNGFVITTDGGKLWLIGGDEYGTLFAVYELLESYLDCRFYTAAFERVPTRKNVTLHIPEDKQIPVLETRDTYWRDVRNHLDYSLKRKTMKPRWANKMCHTMPELAEAGDGVSADPCLSDPNVYETVLKNVRALLAASPDARYISVSQSDANKPCTCEKCSASAKIHGLSGHYLLFVNRIAEAIADEFPHVLVHTFAYVFTETPPLSDVVPADNVMIQLCTIRACFAHPLTDCHLEADYTKNDSPVPLGYEKWFADWSAICNHMSAWTYTYMVNDFHIPNPNWESLWANMRLFADNHVMYLFAEGNSSVIGEFSELRAYLITLLMWDPYMSREDYYAHMDEFLQDYYGPGWKSLREFIDAGIEYADYVAQTTGTHMSIWNSGYAFYPCSEERIHGDDEIPVLTAEELRNFRETDWSRYYDWFVKIGPNPFILKGQQYFDKAFAAAVNTEQYKHLEKSSIQIEYLLCFDYMKKRTLQAKNTLQTIFHKNVLRAIDAGEMTAAEGRELEEAFGKECFEPLEKAEAAAIQSLQDKLSKYEITKFSL